MIKTNKSFFLIIPFITLGCSVPYDDIGSISSVESSGTIDSSFNEMSETSLSETIEPPSTVIDENSFIVALLIGICGDTW